MADIFDQLTAEEAATIQPAGQGGVSEPSQRESREGLGSDPAQYTLQKVKEVSQQLLKHGLLEAETKPKLYQDVLTHREELNRVLEPLDLVVRIDDIRGLAYVAVADRVFDAAAEEGLWSHPLVRRQRLNLEQSLLIAILRKHFVNYELEAGVGDNAAVMHLDELLPEVSQFLGDMGSEARENKRLRNLLEQLKSYGIVSDLNEHDQFTIRPLIAHVASPGNLKSLLAAFLDKARKIEPA